MAFLLYIVYELLVRLSAATASEADPAVAGKIKTVQVMTVISWHLFCSVFVPHARNSSSTCGCLHSVELLRLRHHLQVRCRIGHLPNLLRQIAEAGSPGVKRRTRNRLASQHATHDFY